MSMPIVGQNDIGVNLNFTIRDNKGTIVDVTGVTATLAVVPVVDIGLGNMKTFPLVVSDPTNGLVVRKTDGTEFPNGDCKYLLQATVQFSDGRTFRSSVVKIMVRADIQKILAPYATQGIGLL